MKLSSVRYLTKEGVKNIWVNRLMSLASIGVLVACMVIIGLAVLISENVNKAIGNLEEQNVVMVYMKDYNWALYDSKTEAEENDATVSNENDQTAQAATDTAETKDEDGEKADANGIKDSDYVIHNKAEAEAFKKELEKIANVEKVELISPEESLEDMKPMLGEQADYFDFPGDENPMSWAAKVTMKDMEKFDETISKIEKFEEVHSIVSQKDLANTINAIKNGVGIAGIWIIAILMIISLVIVSNTIRVTMYNRKLEISIMKAVGATDAFVRIPFIVEGMIIGLISALLSEGILYFCYRVATETIVNTLGTSDIVKYGDMALILLALFGAIGIFSGIVGSVIMIRKYLKREGSEFAAI